MSVILRFFVCKYFYIQLIWLTLRVVTSQIFTARCMSLCLFTVQGKNQPLIVWRVTLRVSLPPGCDGTIARAFWNNYFAEHFAFCDDRFSHLWGRKVYKGVLKLILESRKVRWELLNTSRMCFSIFCRSERKSESSYWFH